MFRFHTRILWDISSSLLQRKEWVCFWRTVRFLVGLAVRRFVNTLRESQEVLFVLRRPAAYLCIYILNPKYVIHISASWCLIGMCHPSDLSTTCSAYLHHLNSEKTTTLCHKTLNQMQPHTPARVTSMPASPRLKMPLDWPWWA